MLSGIYTEFNYRHTDFEVLPDRLVQKAGGSLYLQLLEGNPELGCC